jgi:adenine-specific DNA-methyltransferase
LAAINDLIEQIEDARLRDRLSKELEEFTKGRTFGLVFERHLPELMPLHSARPKRGDLVCPKGASLTDVWRVSKLTSSRAECVMTQSEEHRTFSLDDLVVVRQFGEPIFPSLTPMGKIENGTADQPWHTLIEADNYHALQLLEYLYSGKVDCIYIDPPYNTGARDWKYNNDYVDSNDLWRHSKWLSFMEKRLKLAQRLLKPDTGVLIVTVDEHEVHHLGMLLAQLFPNKYRQMVTIVTTPGGVTQGRFSRVEEYALFCFNSEAFTVLSQDDLLSFENGKKVAAAQDVWQSLIRRGVGSQRKDRPGMFFPINVDPTTRKILGAGNPLPLDKEPDWGPAVKKTIAWPVRSDGELGRWRIGPKTFNSLLEKGYVKLGGYDEKRRTWTVLYLQRKAIAEIEDGILQVLSRDAVTNTVILGHGVGSEQLKPIKTVWNRSAHHAGSHGSTLLRNILGESGRFSFPKSIYATRDALAAIVRNNPNALILDFFAGSGTTLNAVNLMNASDGGKRRCILVTNNEVSGEEADRLRKSGAHPGTATWENQGICRSVTWPRSKYTILGRRDDGTLLPGDYLTGRFIEKEKDRKYIHVGYLGPEGLDARWGL